MNHIFVKSCFGKKSIMMRVIRFVAEIIWRAYRKDTASVTRGSGNRILLFIIIKCYKYIYNCTYIISMQSYKKQNKNYLISCNSSKSTVLCSKWSYNSNRVCMFESVRKNDHDRLKGKIKWLKSLCSMQEITDYLDVQF